jgi:hypothetical protein
MKTATGQVIKVQLDVSMGDVCSHFERMPVRARAREAAHLLRIGFMVSHGLMPVGAVPNQATSTVAGSAVGSPVFESKPVPPPTQRAALEHAFTTAFGDDIEAAMLGPRKKKTE